MNISSLASPQNNNASNLLKIDAGEHIKMFNTNQHIEVRNVISPNMTGSSIDATRGGLHGETLLKYRKLRPGTASNLGKH